MTKKRFNPQKIRHLLLDRGITQKTLAGMLDISEAALHDKLVGKRQFKTDELVILLDYLGLPFEFFCEAQ